MKKVLNLMVSLFIFTATAAYAETIDVKVNGLVCDFCARTIEKTFMRTGQVEEIEVNLGEGYVKVTTKPGAEISDEKITQLITDAGYDLKSITRG
jgi:copper chaperone CopZ